MYVLGTYMFNTCVSITYVSDTGVRHYVFNLITGDEILVFRLLKKSKDFLWTFFIHFFNE